MDNVMAATFLTDAEARLHLRDQGHGRAGDSQRAGSDALVLLLTSPKPNPVSTKPSPRGSGRVTGTGEAAPPGQRMRRRLCRAKPITREGPWPPAVWRPPRSSQESDQDIQAVLHPWSRLPETPASC